ncbi:uncharacterized protein BX664DRAFT_335422 [Halteromyces radiatus]|uniref:uncharacterized protein n=1 Tax=Halteromyces radiatus TaxID=101107 RepID=UPI00221E7716|nr:uncharacterized protein BX664DRAFT_335422 [Halteromyces radiatus]KAI8086283.1 hypothetical protein BX664DRAFT_335422 [Halteromyces radiatus]
MTRTDSLPVNHIPNTIAIEPYWKQHKKWPTSENTMLSQYDKDSVVVYQTVSKEVAAYGVKYQELIGSDGYAGLRKERKRWTRLPEIRHPVSIYPSFLGAQYAWEWNSKINEASIRQQRTLAIRIRREIYDEWLKMAKQDDGEELYDYDFCDNCRYPDYHWVFADASYKARNMSLLTYCWINDMYPVLPLDGSSPHQRLPRKVMRLLLRGSMVNQFVSPHTILSIEDITPFVVEMRSRLTDHKSNIKDIWTPSERVYDSPLVNSLF